ncbi:hypothetical protein B0H14DRAFT_3639908 [Mycena olivaceomarginata]|nr:hypothetical protein B0H14DRAFT_3639908 [Mycena olivaceomarginata]
MQPGVQHLEHFEQISSVPNACTIHVDCHNFRQFCELLATQRLNIYIGRLHLKSHVIDERFAGGPNETSQFNDHLHLLTGLPSLKYLSFEYHHDSLLPGFFAAIAQNFASVTDPEFSSMHFDAFSQFVEILNLLTCLRCVALNGVLWYDVDSDSDSEEDATLPTYMPGSLADFVANCRFQQMAPVLHWLPSQPSIHRLAIAMGALSYINLNTALVSDVLRTLSGSLKHLIVCDGPRTFVPDLSCLTVLRTLEIAGIQPLPHNSCDDFQWVPALLSLLNSPVLQCIVLATRLQDRAGLDLLDWPRLAEILGSIRSLRWVDFYLLSHKNWAAQVISERLGPCMYVLRVNQLEGQYEYSLGMFDR